MNLYVYGDTEALEDWTLYHDESYDWGYGVYAKSAEWYLNDDATFIIETGDTDAGEETVLFMQIGYSDLNNHAACMALLRAFLEDWTREDPRVETIKDTIIDQLIQVGSVAVDLKDYNDSGTLKYYISGEGNYTL